MDLDRMVYGKLPPQAKEIEEAILGAIMLEKGAFDIAVEWIKQESFYLNAHQRIFRAFQQLVVANKPVDMLTVVEQLRHVGELDEVGGAYYITKLTNSVVSGANIEDHSKIIQQKYIQRELIRLGGNLVVEGMDNQTDAFDLLDKTEGQLFQLTSGNVKSNISTLESQIVIALGRIEQLRERKNELTGVPTGFPALDRLTCGWQNPDLIILAARPSVGKTAFALNLARNAALHPDKPTPVAFFSLEMSKAQLTERLLSAESGIWLDKIRRGRMDDNDMRILYEKAVTKLVQAPIFIDDTAALNIFELRAKARRLKSKHKIGLIIIDYLQLMGSMNNGKNTNREQEVSRISRDLKALAKELNLPIIALSQLSRDLEKRKGGKPQLSDLRESGAIEQDADIVAFLTRADYQKMEEEVDSTCRNDAEVLFRKHRNGSLDELAFKTDLSIQQWFEPAQYDEHTRISGWTKLPVISPGRMPPRDFSEPMLQQDELPF